MTSALNELLLQLCIIRSFERIHSVYLCCSIMKTSNTGKDLSFHQQYQNQVGLRRTTLVSPKKQNKTKQKCAIYQQERYDAAYRAEHNGKCSKQDRLYMTIKNISRLLKSLNATHKGAYHFCMNCVSCFHAVSARGKYYKYCHNNGHVKVKMSYEKERWLKFHGGEYQCKVPFMLYADFESILKPVDEQ